MPPSGVHLQELQMFSVSSPNTTLSRGEGGTSTKCAFTKRPAVKCTTDNSKSKPDVSSEQKNYIYTKVTSDDDFNAVLRSLISAEESCWYYGDCSSAEAKAILKHQALGTFIMRNSSDPKFLFSLSVKTERGPTSVRIKYSHGLFQMDCEEHLKNRLPKFDNVIGLVSFHIALSKTKGFSDCRWLEKSGRRDMSVTLCQPKKRQVPSLKHLSRLAVNSLVKDRHIPETSIRTLPVPASIHRYLEEYPYPM